ncbi:MAG: phosphonate C-P lyase system protein PhnG [Burkholderiaceae bacterium]|nr:phosphonate C-P lyase system protein PhnG [Burkholderiaceae bacterium]
MSVLAHAPQEPFNRLVAGALGTHAFRTLRAPEVGLAMVRARADGAGAQFNLGEATIARCALRYDGPDGVTTVGLGYRLGRDVGRVRQMAALDALLQHSAHQADLLRSVIEPLAAAIDAERAQAQRRAAATRVQFFTLQAEVAR